MSRDTKFVVLNQRSFDRFGLLFQWFINSFIIGKNAVAVRTRICWSVCIFILGVMQKANSILCQPATAFLLMINEVYKSLQQKTKAIKGSLVENNKLYVSVHYRCVDEKVCFSVQMGVFCVCLCVLCFSQMGVSWCFLVLANAIKWPMTRTHDGIIIWNWTLNWISQFFIILSRWIEQYKETLLFPSHASRHFLHTCHWVSYEKSSRL